MSDKKTEREIEAARIRELAAILNETGLTEIELESGDLRIRVSRATTAIAAQVAQPVAAAAPVVAAPAAAGSPSPSPSKHPGSIPSPMVGTAYLSSAPGAAPFVKVGDRVTQGQTLMIIEAMKTMNPIASPKAGTVKEIFVSDAQPVEYGEALMIVE